MLKITKQFLKDYIEKAFGDLFMTLRTIKYSFLSAKKGDIGTKEIIYLALALFFLYVMYRLYIAWTPNPQRVAKNFTEVTRVGPFA